MGALTFIFFYGQWNQKFKYNLFCLKF